MSAPTAGARADDLGAGGNLRGILAMCGAMAAFITNDMFLKLASESLPMGQLIFMRGVVATAIILTLAVWTDALRVPPRAGRKALGLRTLGELGATLLYLTALFQIPIANATAILQAMPIIMTIAAALFLGEVVRWRRWLAVLAGFVGMLLIVRPGASAFDAYALFAVASLGFTALRDLSTRFIPPAIPSLLVVAVASSSVTVAGGALSTFEDWAQPAPRQIAYIVLSGSFITAGYLLIVDAMRHGEVSVVTPFRYTIILFAIVYGLLVWGELPDLTAAAGIVLIVASGLFVFYRENKVKRSRRTATESAPEQP